MHDVLRERIWRHLEALPEERLYQVLDYIEFLSSKYARDNVRPPDSPLRRFGERLEDKLRVHRVGLGAIRGTMQVVGTADRMVSGLADMGRSLLREVTGEGERAERSVAPARPTGELPAAGNGAAGRPPTPPAAPPTERTDIPVDE